MSGIKTNESDTRNVDNIIYLTDLAENKTNAMPLYTIDLELFDNKAVDDEIENQKNNYNFDNEKFT